MSEKLVVKIPGGHLVATKTTDPDYPGIDVEFVAEGYDGTYTNPRVLVEYSKEKDLRAFIWNNEKSEDYTEEIILKESNDAKRLRSIDYIAEKIYEDEKLEFEDIDTIREFLTKSNIEELSEYHIEFSEEDLFDWLHDRSESPSEIRKAPLPSEMSNVLEVRGRWIYWCD